MKSSPHRCRMASSTCEAEGEGWEGRGLKRARVGEGRGLERARVGEGEGGVVRVRAWVRMWVTVRVQGSGFRVQDCGLSLQIEAAPTGIRTGPAPTSSVKRTRFRSVPP
eukprot:315419-Prymnesium_polylepis.1